MRGLPAFTDSSIPGADQLQAMKSGWPRFMKGISPIRTGETVRQKE